MPEWVIQSLTILERQTIHSLDTRKPLLWCSVACFLLMLTSMDILFAYLFFVEQRELYHYPWMLLELIFFLVYWQISWSTRCTWEASTQWCCTEGCLILICWKIVHLLFLSFWQGGIICVFLYILSSFGCNLLLNVIVLVLVRISLTINSPFL